MEVFEPSDNEYHYFESKEEEDKNKESINKKEVKEENNENQETKPTSITSLISENEVEETQLGQRKRKRKTRSDTTNKVLKKRHRYEKRRRRTMKTTEIEETKEIKETKETKATEATEVIIPVCPISLDKIEKENCVYIRSGTRHQIYDVHYLWNAINADPEHRDPITRLPLEKEQLQMVIDHIRSQGCFALSLIRLSAKVKMIKWATTLRDLITAMNRPLLLQMVDTALEYALLILESSMGDDEVVSNEALKNFQESENHIFFALSVTMAIEPLFHFDNNDNDNDNDNDTNENEDFNENSLLFTAGNVFRLVVSPLELRNYRAPNQNQPNPPDHKENKETTPNNENKENKENNEVKEELVNEDVVYANSNSFNEEVDTVNGSRNQIVVYRYGQGQRQGQGQNNLNNQYNANNNNSSSNSSSSSSSSSSSNSSRSNSHTRSRVITEEKQRGVDTLRDNLLEEESPEQLQENSVSRRNSSNNVPIINATEDERFQGSARIMLLLRQFLPQN